MKKLLCLISLVLFFSEFTFAAVFSVNNASATEGSNVSFIITATATSTSPCTKNETYSIAYTTANGTAINSDYTSKNDTYSKKYTSTTKTSGVCFTTTISIATTNDTIYETDEIFYFNLSNPSSNATISTAQGIGTIKNNDTVPFVSISSDVTHSEGNSGTTDFTFTMTQNKVSIYDTTFYFSTVDNTAKAEYNDYTPISNLLVTIPAGSTTTTVTVLVNGDTIYESSENFKVVISNPTNATLGTATRVGYITNDDGASNLRDFELVQQYNINGNMQIIGNSVKLNSGGTCAPNNTNNNSLTIEYADKDNDSSTYNSTSADLVLPKNVKSNNILYAYLYWQGRTSGTNYVQYGTNVKIKPYGFTDYQIISTIPSKFNWKDSDYQGVADVTSYIKTSIDSIPDSNISSSGYNYPLWVADVYAPQNSNGFGAWSLVIVYKDSTASLKNISVYDGYLEVINSTKTATLSNFLTPTNGVVNSKFLIFAGEGDISLTDSVSMTNASGTDVTLGNNVFKSSEDINGVNVTNRNPACQNTIGVDIRTFDVGSNGSPAIIGNSQTSTTVKLISTGDEYFPGVFAFSTELYIPDVCYEESVTFNDIAVSDSNTPTVGNELEYIVSITNKNNEPAKGVYIEKTFDEKDGLSYVEKSMHIAPIPGTTYELKGDSSTDNDTAQYDFDSNTSKFFIGTDANSSQGGTISYNAITKLKYKAKILQSNINENSYLVSYRNDQLGISFSGLPIRKCADFNNTIVATAPIGIFNVVNEKFSGSTDPIVATDSLNALYTQIVGKDFNITVLALESDKTTLKTYTGDVNLTLITKPTYTGDINADQALCAAAPSLDSSIKISFDGTSKIVSPYPAYSKANKNVQFKIAYRDSNNTISYVCSRDSFAIRPKSFQSTITTNQQFIADKDETITFSAYQNNNSTLAIDYNESINTSFKVDVNITDTSKSCAETAIAFSPSIGFSNGSSTYSSYHLPNVGDFNVTIYEKPGFEYAVVDAADTPDTDRFITSLTRQISVVPASFLIDGNFSNGSNSFTYLSNFDKPISSLLDLNITAKSYLNTTTSNYTAACYAKDANLTLTTMTIGTNLTGLSKLLWYDTQHDLDGNITLDNSSIYTLPLNHTQFDSSTTNGMATVKYRINFDRKSDTLIQPFRFTLADVNTTNSNSIKGSKILDQNTTFYYGRAHAPDYRFPNRDGNATIYYEVYCKDCNQTTRNNLGITGNESVNAINWYQNALHVNTAGAVIPVPQHASDFSNTGITHTNPVSIERLTLQNATTLPYVDKVNLNSSEWLVYYPTDFTVEFYSFGSWAGTGFVKQGQPNATDTNTTVGEFIHKTAPIKANRRITW